MCSFIEIIASNQTNGEKCCGSGGGYEEIGVTYSIAILLKKQGFMV